MTVKNNFGPIDFKQLTDASGSRAVLTNNCISCHGVGKPAQASWKLSTLADGSAATDASWLETSAKAAKVKQNAGLSSVAPSATHSKISMSPREKALLNLWFTAPVE